jgi:hypothetical protein
VPNFTGIDSDDVMSYSRTVNGYLGGLKVEKEQVEKEEGNKIEKGRNPVPARKRSH